MVPWIGVCAPVRVARNAGVLAAGLAVPRADDLAMAFDRSAASAGAPGASWQHHPQQVTSRGGRGQPATPGAVSKGAGTQLGATGQAELAGTQAERRRTPIGGCMIAVAAVQAGDHPA
jgi:hypothetical protein